MSSTNRQLIDVLIEAVKETQQELKSIRVNINSLDKNMVILDQRFERLDSSLDGIPARISELEKQKELDKAVSSARTKIIVAAISSGSAILAVIVTKLLEFYV